MIAAVGTKNPIKIAAAEIAMKKVFPEIDIVSISVPSGVPDQPMSDEEAIRGAITRAHNALKEKNSDFGIGMEGNIHRLGHHYFLTGWAAVVDKNGKVGIGSGGRLELPNKIIKKILSEGKELGSVSDELTGIENVKQKMGTSGILTKGLKTRQAGWEECMYNALVKFISPEFYDE